MRRLLDSCVWAGARDELRAIGHDVVWAGDWPEDPGDAEILARAHSERRIQARAIAQVIERHGAELVAGAIVTAEPSRLRIRPAGEDESA